MENNNNNNIDITSNKTIDNNENLDEDNSSSEKFWLSNPYVLFEQDKIFSLWPLESMSREAKVNAITRLILFITLGGMIIFRDLKIIVTSVITIVFLILTYYYLNRQNNLSILNKLKEGFSDESYYEANRDNFTTPETKNPTMSVLLPEINDNPDRLKAAPSYNRAVKKEINDSAKDIIKKNFNDNKIESKLFENLGDKQQFEQSMRQFYTPPNTQIPNNQGEFLNFCYGNLASCKDGDTNCY